MVRLSLTLIDQFVEIRRVLDLLCGMILGPSISRHCSDGQYIMPKLEIQEL